MSSAIHISLDLETLSLASNAAIIQIGAITHKGDRFECYIDPKSSERAGLDVSTETIQWWSMQSSELRKRVMSGTTSLSVALHNFWTWCCDISGGDLDRIYLWTKGADFDLPILRNAYETFMEYPFNHRNHRCLRTLSASHNIPCPPAKIPHDAMSDAEAQLVVINKWLDAIR